MDIQKNYYRIISTYFALLFVSGLLAEASLIFPYISNPEINIYFVAKNMHNNIFHTGLFLNILPAFAVSYSRLHDLNDTSRKSIVVFFWLYEIIIFWGILGNMIGQIPVAGVINFEWYISYSIFFLFCFFMAVTWNFYSNDSLKKTIWNYFILIPLASFFIIFLFSHIFFHSNVISFSGFRQTGIMNILQVTSNIYLYNYFFVILVSGILYLGLLPDNYPDKNSTRLKARKVPAKLSREYVILNFKKISDYIFVRAKVFFYIIFKKSINQISETFQAENIGIIKNLKNQWKLQTGLFVIFLFYKIQYFQDRENIAIAGKLINVIYPFSFFYIMLNLKLISKRFSVPDHIQNLLKISLMFLTVYIVAEVFLGFEFIIDLFGYTELVSGQRHLLISGFFLPVLYIFLSKNFKEFFMTSTKRQVVYRFKKNTILHIWWILTLYFAVSSWGIGGIEAGLWNKLNAFGYLEYPGWREIIQVIKPYRISRFALFMGALIFIFLVPSVLIIFRQRYRGKS